MRCTLPGLVVIVLAIGIASTILHRGGPDRVLRTIAVGRSAGTMLADERAGRAFLYDTGAASVEAIDTRTGAPAYRISRLELDTETAAHGGAPFVLDARSGRVFVANDDGTVGVLDAQDGRIIRTTTVVNGIMPDGPRQTGLFLAEHTGRLFVSESDGSLSLLDAASGALLGPAPGLGLGSTAELAVSARYGRVIAADSNNRAASILGISTLDAATGRIVYTAPTRGGFVPVNNRLMLGAAGPPALSEKTGRAYVFDPSCHCVRVLESATGRLRTSVSLAAGCIPRLTIDEPAGTVWVWAFRQSRSGTAPSGCAGTPLILDAASARRAGTVRTMGWTDAIDARGQIYGLRADGIAVLDGRSGRVVRTILTGGTPTALQIDDARHALYVALAPDAIGAFDARTGAPRWRVRVGGHVTLLGQDRHSGRIFATYDGCASHAPSWNWLPPWVREHLPLPAPAGDEHRELMCFSTIDVTG